MEPSWKRGKGEKGIERNGGVTCDAIKIVFGDSAAKKNSGKEKNANRVVTGEIGEGGFRLDGKKTQTNG